MGGNNKMYVKINCLLNDNGYCKFKKKFLYIFKQKCIYMKDKLYCPYEQHSKKPKIKVYGQKDSSEILR